MVIEAPIAFLPRTRLLTPKLFAKVFTNERMRIELPRIMQIFPSDESCSSQLSNNRSPLGRAQMS
jgi:hypothetical protein